MNKPRLRWLRAFGEYIVHDREPGEPLSSRITIAANAKPEIAYRKFVERIQARNWVATATFDPRFYESVYRKCLSPYARLKRAFTHKPNGSRRFP